MPTIYTEDQVAKAVEDHYYGTQGVRTGSVANSIGLREYDSQKASRPSGSASTDLPGRRDSRSDPMLAPFRSILDAIPWWLYLVLAVIGGMCGYVVLGTAISGASGPFVAIGLGAFLGWLILPLTVAVIDFAVRLAWILLKITAFLGGAAAIAWVIVQSMA
jgi:hypothetical protein